MDLVFSILRFVLGLVFELEFDLKFGLGLAFDSVIVEGFKGFELELVEGLVGEFVVNLVLGLVCEIDFMGGSGSSSWGGSGRGVSSQG